MNRMDVPEGGAPEPSPETNILSEFMTRAELSEQLGLAESTLREWASARKGPATTKIGQRVFYNRETVRQWLRTQETPWPGRGR